MRISSSRRYPSASISPTTNSCAFHCRPTAETGKPSAGKFDSCRRPENGRKGGAQSPGRLSSAESRVGVLMKQYESLQQQWATREISHGEETPRLRHQIDEMRRPPVAVNQVPLRLGEQTHAPPPPRPIAPAIPPDTRLLVQDTSAIQTGHLVAEIPRFGTTPTASPPFLNTLSVVQKPSITATDDAADDRSSPTVHRLLPRIHSDRLRSMEESSATLDCWISRRRGVSVRIENHRIVLPSCADRRNVIYGKR